MAMLAMLNAYDGDAGDDGDAGGDGNDRGR
jgi:hypothetical protein